MLSTCALHDFTTNDPACLEKWSRLCCIVIYYLSQAFYCLFRQVTVFFMRIVKSVGREGVRQMV